ncbi:LacI family DNA-binding transcriptional regulator [Aureibaculum marinum]|uniref:LacI family DNA-binding transcriptional regulator n=1 Tax=Aureibaculum marinum TaxID=2487930 RepID=A0A3N4NHW6_9FLAO|nr:LacI family DNA-binding transcriptional regulator [Aureibaculum marinum]RPD96002.1 LacI family DNA-binding transcriptional regulator [Aureibaculum marinum]
MSKKYTIRDIAELAGVSKGTVDRVLHNRGRVSETALKRVTNILDEIDYHPNLIARNLKNNKAYTIYVLLPNPEQDPYWEPCLEGVNSVVDEFNAFGVNIKQLFFSPKSTKSFLQANNEIQKATPDAVLLVPLFFKEASVVMKQYERLGIVVSIFNNTIETVTTKNFIGQNLYQSGRVGAKLLQTITSKGDLAVIHIDEKYKNAVFMQEKERGFESFFKEISNYKVLKCKLKHPDFDSLLNRFLKSHPNLTGIFVTTSKVYQVADFLKKNNYTNIALVGYDLLDENVNHLKTGTIDFLIHQNPKQQAYLGLKFLVEHFLFEKNIPNQLLLPIDIINSENVTQFLRS